MRISDWSSDVCSSDLQGRGRAPERDPGAPAVSPRDIRDLQGDPEAYAAELRRRWGGLLSYRYLGRSYGSMDLGPVDDTVTLRRDMRDSTGGLLLAVIGISSPEGGAMSDLDDVPTPVIHSCQILDPGLDGKRIEVRSELLKRGRQMRSEEHTSELQSLMRISYAVFCLKKKKKRY